MSRLSFLICLLVTAATTGCATRPPATAPDNPWPRVKTVAPALPGVGEAQIFGSYSAGCLRGAEPLALDGEGYQVMRPSRHRSYGHPELIRFVTELSRRTRTLAPSPLLIGDLAMPRGGPTNSNHRSHQTGLDVDIWFWQNPDAAKRPLTADERETLSSPSMVNADGRSLNKEYWSDAQVAILRTAAGFDDVERIFVNPAIKRALCTRFGGKHQAWLKKLRPWWGHDDHFHVRLRCPEADKGCIHQESPPNSEECDANLDWWFSDEAAAKGKGYETGAIPPIPKLPAACEAVLNEP